MLEAIVDHIRGWKACRNSEKNGDEQSFGGVSRLASPHTPRFLTPRGDSSRVPLKGSGLEHLSLDLNPGTGSIAGGTEELCHLACFGRTITKAFPDASKAA